MYAFVLLCDLKDNDCHMYNFSIRYCYSLYHEFILRIPIAPINIFKVSAVSGLVPMSAIISSVGVF
jgi:hypothetical protein